MSREIPGRLLVAGDLNPDLVLSVTPEGFGFGEREILTSEWDLTVGGSASIFAVAAARLGASTELIGVLGGDGGSAFMERALAEAGVELSRCRREPEGRGSITVVLSSPADRAIITGTATSRPLAPEDVKGALSGVAHVHVAGLFVVPEFVGGLLELMQQARAAGASTSLDTNWDPDQRWELPSRLGEVLDFLLVNEQEALALAGSARDLDGARERLAELAGTAVVKRGSAGALAFGRDGDIHAVPGFAADVVDTTGAGDNFDAGFVCAQMLGLDLDQAVRLGCACGALSTRARGGTAAAVTLEESLALADLVLPERSP